MNGPDSASASSILVRVDMVAVGERARKDLGDLSDLADSMRRMGDLINPITILPDRTLVAGERRLAAAKLLGWELIPCRIVMSVQEAGAALLAERDENTCRKPFTPSEMVAVGRRIEEMAAAEAKERQGTRTDLQPCGNLPRGSDEERKARTVAAKVAGTSPRTYDKAKAVVAAASDETAPGPVREVAKAAVEEMDRTGKVDPAYQAVRAAQFAEDRRKALGSEDQDADLARAKLRQRIALAAKRASEGIVTFDPELVASVVDGEREWALWEFTAEQHAKWFATLLEQKPRRLTVVDGGGTS